MVAKDAFDDQGLYKDTETPTKFKPQFSLSVAELKPGAEPAVTTNIYQTKAELEVRDVRMLIEHASCHYEKLKEGLVVGGGQLEVGTPPKITLPITVTVTSTDGVSSAVLAVKAENALAKVYLADLRIKQNDGNLSIVSISNTSRANDANGVHTTEASARAIQVLNPGFVVLPAVAGPMRTRVIITSEADPVSQQVAQRVFRETYTLAP